MPLKFIYYAIHQVRSAMKTIASCSPASVPPNLGTVFLYSYTSTSVGEIEERPVTQVVDFSEPQGRVFFLDGFPHYINHRGTINSFKDAEGNFDYAVFASVSKSQTEAHREEQIKKNSLTSVESDKSVGSECKLDGQIQKKELYAEKDISKDISKDMETKVQACISTCLRKSR